MELLDLTFVNVYLSITKCNFINEKEDSIVVIEFFLFLSHYLPFVSRTYYNIVIKE